MTQRRLRAGPVALGAALAALLLVTARLPAEPTPGKQDRPTPGKQDQLVAEMVCQFLQRGHLSRPEIGDDLSRKLFRRFLKDLDPFKLYFTKADVEELKKDETELDDQLLQGDLSFAYKVYDRLVKRLGERLKLAEDLLKAPQDFTAKEYLETDYDKIDFASSEDEMRDRWRKRIKFELLLQRLETKELPHNTPQDRARNELERQQRAGPKPPSEAEARQKILDSYKGRLKRWKQVDNYDLMEMYLSALTACVDPHSSYMSPTTLADFDIAMRLHLEGIGALLRSDNGQTLVVEVVPGGAAAKDGRLKPKDKIIGVAQGDGDFVDVTDRKLTEVVKMIRGPRGTKIRLKVVPADKIEPAIIDLTRQTIELKSQEARQEIIAQGKKADGTPYRIGVIDLPSFYADTAAAKAGREYKSATEDVRKILKEFEAKKVDGVVLDLRRNPGGSLQEALALTGLFINRGPIVQVKGPRGDVQHYDDPENGTAYAGPLMVLVSHGSASASEILAGALQDYGRALVVGDPATHGKGTVQVVIDLGNQIRPDNPLKLGALKLTIQQFYRVNGDSTQSRGVASDIVVPALTEELGMSEKELDNALAFDRVPPVEYEKLGMVPDDLKARLRARSAERVKNSAEFQKLLKEITQLKARRERKAIPLNEKELREQFSKEDAEKAADKAEGITPPEQSPEGVYKFPRNFVNKEILQIMEDFLLDRKLAASR